MKNNFLNNNGATLLQNKNSKKTQVESRIDDLKLQEQAIVAELSSWETKQKKAERLISYLDEVNKFSTKHLAEAIEEVKKEPENYDDWWLENLIGNKVEFALKFKSMDEAFAKLVFQKIENRKNRISYLKSQLRTIQSQLSHQERLFARMEIRRQGRTLLECKYKDHLGCLGVYQCGNCQINYSITADNNQATEITK